MTRGKKSRIKSKTKEKKRGIKSQPISLHPLSLEEALRIALRTPLPKKERNIKRKEIKIKKGKG